MANAEYCVCCGKEIPEGRQVCIICGHKVGYTNYDQTNIIRVPNDAIIYVQDKWLVLNMESKDLGEAIKRIIDCANK